MRLLNRHGVAQALQARALDRWIDGSIRWAEIDFQADIDDSDETWTATPDDGHPRPVVARPVTIEGARIDTGALRFTIDPARAWPIVRVTREGTDADPVDDASLHLSSPNGATWHFSGGAMRTLVEGPLRVTVAITGTWTTAEHARSLESEIVIDAFAGLPTLRCACRLRNPHPAAHADAFWDLGDPGSVLIGGWTWRQPVRGWRVTHAAVDPDTALTPVPAPWRLHQHGSGGAAWDSPVHVNASGAVPIRERGYELRAGDAIAHGLRATPIVRIEDDHGTIGATLPQFWQNCPRAIAADTAGLTVEFWPDAGGPYELQGGEQKTHRFVVSYGDDGVSEQPLAWCLSPTVLVASAACYAASGDLPRQADVPHAGAPAYARLTDRGFEGETSFFAKRERIDEYGWRHFGDLYADHETARDTGTALFPSHYNNQYDPIGAFATVFLRTGDPRAWTLMDDLARHVIDIDIYHTDGDRAAYRHGLFWHTNHYTPAATATHRAYARSSGLHGGGPSNEHNYTTGLLLHYLLTGHQPSADAVVELADWVLVMEDGTQSRFRWIDRGPTGLATSTYSADYHGPGRGAGNSVNALVDAHRVTGRRAYLDAAEALIRRTVHPADDPARHDLLDAERRWSYGVFLQVLGRYLDDKRARGEMDAMYAYARESLLTYARWMAAHEVPVLDRPERVEFPTETWAAQDLRKADVLNTARRYAPEADWPALVARRDFFFDYAVRTLTAMPTSHFTRPLVLLLVNGSRVAYAATDDHVPYTVPPAFAPFVPFVPQKQRVLRRLMVAGLAGLVGLAAALTAWFWR